MRKTRKTPLRRRRIAPRLASGEPRQAFGHGLPREVKEGLRAIAAHEQQSMSWVIEQVIMDYFGLKRPRYILPKGKKE